MRLEGGVINFTPLETNRKNLHGRPSMTRCSSRYEPEE